LRGCDTISKKMWAIVTGGSGGIGSSICKTLAKNDYNTVVGYHLHKGAAKELQKELGKYDVNVKTMCLDVSHFDEVSKKFTKLIDEIGNIDVLINCAGIIKDKTLRKMSYDAWNEVINVNLTGIFNCSRATISSMIDHNYGRIVNISSVVAYSGNYGQTNYSASKAGVIGFTKSLALETAKYDITANAVCPGFIKTHMTDVIPEEIKRKIIQKIPKKRLGLPDEISRVVDFLISPKAGYITGQAIHVNGGLYM